MKLQSNWYVLTGGPGCGKTTLLNALKDKGYTVIPEASRTLIDRGIAKGINPTDLRKNEEKFQYDVLNHKAHMEKKTDPNKIAFFDRGMHDTIAYFRHYGYELEDWANKLISESYYRKVFLLEPLADYQPDYARTEVGNFAAKIHVKLQEAYSEFGMMPILVPFMSVADRIKFILGHVNKEEIANG